MMPKKTCTIRMIPGNKVKVWETFKVEVELANWLGEITDFKVLLNRYGEAPSIIELMKKEENNKEYQKYSAELQFDSPVKYFFFFSLKINGEDKAIKINRGDGEPIILNPWEESPYWSVVAYNNFSVPDWAKDKIAYQIFVDRFKQGDGATLNQEGRNYRIWGEMPDWGKNEKGEYHNNDFFGGNLKGIEEKMDYFKELSVGILYLSPINESLYRYDRYAATNHMSIDPDAGAFEDLKSLHETANQNGIHLILDVAFNHCGSDNEIFQDALHNGQNSRYRDWFIWDEYGNYRYWYGIFRDMPIFNQNNPEFQEYIYGEHGVVATLGQYVDGFRLDVAEELQPFFLEGIRNRANHDKKSLIIGECWQYVPIKILGKGLDCPTNYPFTDGILKFVTKGNSEALKGEISYILDNYPQETIDTMFNSLDTHDIPRAITMLSSAMPYVRDDYRHWEIDRPPTIWHGYNYFATDEFRRFEFEHDKLEQDDYDLAIKRLKVAVILQYFLPGNPCIFYGTEVGLHGFKDPFNRKCYPWGDEDKELLKFYQEIGKFRSIYTGKESSFEILEANQNVFSFVRRNKTNSVFVMVNRGESNYHIDIPEEFKEEKTHFSLNVDHDYLLPYGGIIILK